MDCCPDTRNISHALYSSAKNLEIHSISSITRITRNSCERYSRSDNNKRCSATHNNNRYETSSEKYSYNLDIDGRLLSVEMLSESGIVKDVKDKKTDNQQLFG